MGKYIGPKSKIARKFGEAIYGADKVLEAVIIEFNCMTDIF